MTTPLPVRSLDRTAAAVLIAAPEEGVRTALRALLEQERHDVGVASDGPAALAALSAGGYGCVVLDGRLANAGPTLLVSRLLERDPTLSVVLLDPGPVPAEELPGVMTRLPLPVELGDLCQAVRAGLRRRASLVESEQINRWLSEEVTRRTAALEQLTISTLEALVNALEAKDRHLLGHSARVATLAARVATECGLPPEAVNQIRIAGQLHDIGKIGVPEEILQKEGPLTAQEFAVVRRHPVLGTEILAPLVHLGPVLDYVRHHHECWDGSGYPDGLAAEAIPIGARIVGAVETYDALTTPRAYQDPIRPGQAIERMRELVGSVLDPAVHEALSRVVSRGDAG